jgi:hypothetical protein
MSEEITQARLEALRKQRGMKLIAYGIREHVRLPFIKNGRRIKDYTCAQIGRTLGRHPDTIYRWFKDYPGVIVKQNPAKRMKDPKTGEWKVKRRHTILLIPPDIFTKWLREHTKK